MTKPAEEDIAVFEPSLLNRYRHVAIIAKVTEDSVAIIQQNPGPFGKSRETYRLLHSEAGTWRVENEQLLGWLLRPQMNRAAAAPPANLGTKAGSTGSPFRLHAPLIELSKKEIIEVGLRPLRCLHPAAEGVC